MEQEPKPCAFCGTAPQYSDLDRLSPWHLNSYDHYWNCPGCALKSVPPKMFRDAFGCSTSRGQHKVSGWNAWQDVLKAHRPQTQMDIQREAVPCSRCGSMPVFDNGWVCPKCGGDSAVPPAFFARYGEPDERVEVMGVWNLWHSSLNSKRSLERLLKLLDGGAELFWNPLYPDMVYPGGEAGAQMRYDAVKGEIGIGGDVLATDSFRQDIYFLREGVDGFVVSMNIFEAGCPVLTPVDIATMETFKLV